MSLQAQEGPRRGTVKKVADDAITITVDGKDLDYTVTPDTKIIDAANKAVAPPLQDKGFRDGATVMFLARQQAGKSVLVGMKLVREGDSGEAGSRRGPSGESQTQWKEEPETGLVPLCDMGLSARYRELDGGLYGGGKNAPPPAHQAAAEAAIKQITPRDSNGEPSPTGKIVFISLGMSNAAGEFMLFKEIADKDPGKSPDVAILNCAIGGAGVRSWTQPQSGTWQKVDQIIKEAGIAPAQVQVAWVKHAEPMPEPDQEVLQYARQVRDDIALTVPIMKSRFPNLKIAYLSSRTYGGYNAVGRRRVNPEPFAYETGFSVRWVIQNQITGEAHRYDQSPVLLWGPYLWADGINPRRDGLTWVRNDFTTDGVHPARDTGGQKVASMLLTFFKENPNAKPWFISKTK